MGPTSAIDPDVGICPANGQVVAIYTMPGQLTGGASNGEPGGVNVGIQNTDGVIFYHPIDPKNTNDNPLREPDPVVLLLLAKGAAEGAGLLGLAGALGKLLGKFKGPGEAVFDVAADELIEQL